MAGGDDARKNIKRGITIDSLPYQKAKIRKSTARMSTITGKYRPENAFKWETCSNCVAETKSNAKNQWFEVRLEKEYEIRSIRVRTNRWGSELANIDVLISGKQCIKTPK